MVGTLIVISAALLIRFALHDYIKPLGVYPIFIISTLVVQYRYGYKYSILALAASVFLAEYYFVEPYGEFSFLSFKDIVITIDFVMVVGFAIFLIERLQRLVYAQKLLRKVNESRQVILLHRENDRLYFSKKSNLSGLAINRVLQNFEKILLLKFSSHPFSPGPAFYQQAQVRKMEQKSSDWHQMIHPQDLEALLLADGIALTNTSSRSLADKFSLRFRADVGDVHCSGEIQRLTIDGESLELWLMPD